jgi:hypothetical protein
MDLQGGLDSWKGAVKFGDIPTLLTYNVTAKLTYSVTVIVGDNNLAMGELNFRSSERELKEREIQRLHYPKV